MFGTVKDSKGTTIPGAWMYGQGDTTIAGSLAIPEDGSNIRTCTVTFKPNDSVLGTYDWTVLGSLWDRNSNCIIADMKVDVQPIDASNLDMAFSDGTLNHKYNGNPISDRERDVYLWEKADTSKTRIPSNNYTLTWTPPAGGNLINPGDVTCEATLKGNFTGIVSRVFHIIGEIPKYKAPTTRIEAVWRDKAKNKLPSTLANYFGYPKNASNINIPGTWALVDENAEVGNATKEGAVNEILATFTPGLSVLDTYYWGGLSWWDANEGKLKVPVPFTVAPLPAKDIAYGVSLGNSDKNIKTTYDGTDKTFGLITFWPKDEENKWNAGLDTWMIGTENFDIDWPEDMINAGTKTFTVKFKNNCTGTLTGTVEIKKRQIVITADNQTIDYGEPLPPLTWQQSGDGFVLGDSLIEGTVAVEESGNYPGPGEYNIVSSGFSTSDPNNYEVSHVNGKLTINGPSAGNVTMPLNQSSFPFNGRRQNLIVTVKDGNDILKENVHYALNIIGDLVNVGQGRAEVTLQAPYATRTLTKDWSITKRDVNVKIDDKCKVKGEDDPTFTYTVTAVDNGETIDGVDLTLTRDSGEDLGGSYTIRLASTSNSNVNIVNVTTGTLKIGTDIFEITPRDISNATVTVTPPSKQYTGGVHTPDVVLTDILNSVTKTLPLNTDYTLTWPSDMTNVGPKQGVITGQGNYQGSAKKTYTITAAPITASDVTLSSSSFTYDGSEQKPTVTVTVGERTLTVDTDYTIIWPTNPVDVSSSYAIKVTGKGNYSGTVTKTYAITRKAVSDSTTDSKLGVTTGSTTFTYNGSPQELGVQITYNGETLQEGVDYTKSYTDASGGNDITNQGTKTLRVTFIKNLDGTITRTYTINPLSITDSKVSFALDPASAVFTGSALTTEAKGTVTFSGTRKDLVKGTDFEFNCPADLINKGDYTLTITGKGNYSGTLNRTFTIDKKEVTDSKPNGITISVKPVEGKVFNGQSQTPDEVTLKDGAKPLIENVDYKLIYPENMINEGEYIITADFNAIEGGNYTGSITATFTITPKQISDNTPESELKVDVDKTGYTDETGYTYDKTPKRPAVTIKAMFGNRTMPLVQGTHFDVNYLAESGTDPSDVTNVGPKKVVITFKNGFSGTRTIRYAINRRDVTIRPENRSKKYKAPDPDMRPRIDYDIINGLIAGDNLYGSFEREDSDIEEVGRYKIIQGTTLTNANNPNYNIIFDAENSGYFVIEVDKSSWGKPQDYPKDHYVDDEGKTSVEVDKYGMVWLKETSDGTSAWYGIDNSKGVFRIGSRFWVMWLSEKENPETYKKYWDMLDEDHKRAMESINGWIFLIGVTDPDGEEYEKFSENEAGETDEEKVVPTYVQIGDDWDEDELVGVFISETEDEDIETTFVDNFEFPEGFDTFGKMMLRHFSPYFIYDEFTDEERRALEGNDDETNVLRTTVDIKGKTVQIIVSGPRRVLPEGTRLIAVVDSRDNTCKMWLVDQSGKELSSPLSERVEVFIEMVDGMEDLIEVRLPKIGEDFHYGKFDGSWYGAIYTPYFPISLSLDELTDAEKDELNKKRGINGKSVEGSGSDGASGDSRNGQRNGSNAENDGQGDNEIEEIQQAENGSSNWWQNLSQYQIICITAAGILLLLLLIFLILLILKRRKEKENSSQK